MCFVTCRSLPSLPASRAVAARESEMDIMEEQDVAGLLEPTTSRGTSPEHAGTSSSHASTPVLADEFDDERITQLESGIAILKEQVKQPSQSKIWLKAMRRADIGADLAQMADDVRVSKQTGTHRRTTWAKAGDKQSERFTRNTMGLAHID
uniref:Uncharacterized protein n=1 Tax=Mycena chlorophos TaxID=658473 RepID=A0ABQ0LFD9_MYCCL|nr:predicted protein [Mycena chlorophos]